jgi:hypothetical protein
LVIGRQIPDEAESTRQSRSAPMRASATNAIFFQEAVKRAAADAKCSGSFALIVVVVSVRLKYMLPRVCE